MPDLTKTDIGRRIYQLHKEKNVERIIEMMRQNLGADWKTFSDQEIHMLERLIGDAWVGIDKAEWEKIPFARITKEDVDRILDIARYQDIDKAPRTHIIDEVKRALLSVR